ncbi:hypothetical protein, partial [Nocardiopsis dassonvillei]|uniref:hypothetical protein n=1 Tax=Nocardiopsis dassonvillei TaxID=2014 RepID=UPI003630C80F
ADWTGHDRKGREVLLGSGAGEGTAVSVGGAGDSPPWPSGFSTGVDELRRLGSEGGILGVDDATSPRHTIRVAPP